MAPIRIAPQQGERGRLAIVPGSLHHQGELADGRFEAIPFDGALRRTERGAGDGQGRLSDKAGEKQG